ncbi:FAD-binding protein [Terriglobus albidus]|uniref:FAD-binding protein n=1 Tax=Terriglobus albidus TaxID=1592106 RepID=A0A5B9EA26_9BACT|nr:D-arabinono-1,4-lactone oxidase [Terriglobus albidus]QEE28982.1 FAD-binding protein [Terriglobus albidus]
MNKREFLKASGSVMAGALLSRMGVGQAPKGAAAKLNRTNWAGNYTYKAARLDEPGSAQEVQQLVTSISNAKALGARHSFNDIADSTGDQVSLKNMTEMTLDKVAGTVTVAAGVTYGKLAPWLDAQGFAVHNLASLPHVSVVGACATATHGSGVHNGNLSTAVRAIEFVDGTGQLKNLLRTANADEFNGAVVGLGALGVITRITLAVVPTFQISQIVYENLSFDQLEHNLDAIFGSGYSVSLFTDWQHHRATQVWLKQSITGSSTPALPPLFYGATLQKTKLHPLAGHSPENCTEQLGVPGPWYERLPHFRMNFTPSSGAELQSEYFVSRAQAYKAILAVEQLRDKITPHLFITELRTIAADDLWLSTAYKRDSVAIHFTWKPEEKAVRSILPLIEEKLAPFDARPHWAKVFTMSHERLSQLYPRLNDFRALAARYDPSRKFLNAYLQNVFGA